MILFLFLAGALFAAMKYLRPIAIERGKLTAEGSDSARRAATQFAALLFGAFLPLCLIIGMSHDDAPGWAARVKSGVILFAMTGGFIALVMVNTFQQARKEHARWLK